ncbi:hypothetical protein SPFM12_00165 [Salmonella phage SPFM12]|nr:hypothetical protein SPFM12_00165 [Salmonella phage SPFM12]
MRKFKISASYTLDAEDVLSLSSTDGGTTANKITWPASVKWPNGAEPPFTDPVPGTRYELLLTLRQGTGADDFIIRLGDPTTALSITPIANPIQNLSGADGVVEIDPNISVDEKEYKLPLSEIGGGGAEKRLHELDSYNGDKSSAVALIR